MNRRDIPPLVTLTLNPSIDVSYEISHMVEDQKIHALSNRYDPGGNGINVARALKRLQIPAHSCFIAAGEIGAFLERLVAREIDDPRCVHIDGETRVNVTLQQQEPKAQYEITGLGPMVTPPALQKIGRDMRALAKSGYVVLTGSLPPGVPGDIYATFTRELKQQSAKVVVDSHGQSLTEAIEEQPFLIKPNRYELEQLVGKSLPTLSDVQREACLLQSRGIAYVCVSLGSKGALLVDGKTSYFGRAPEVAVRSTVGAGDSMVAGLVAAFARGESPAQALRLGIACGSATASKPGTELFDGRDIDVLASAITITATPIEGASQC